MALVLLAGCGAPARDLFAVDRGGSIPGAKLRLAVSDGGQARCDGAGRALPGALLLDARELARDLEELGALGLELPARPGSQLQYVVSLQDGRVAFGDNAAGKPPVLDRLVVFTRQVAREVCGRPR